MNWLIIVIIAHLFNAVVFLVDKYLLSRSIPNPLVYSFYVGLLSLLALLLIPFGFLIPGWPEILIDLATGAILILALILFYFSLRYNEPSRIVPIIGGFVALFTLILSYIFLGERLSGQVILAIFFLLIGSLLITYRKTTKKRQERIIKRVCFALGAAFIFAVFYVLTKYIFLHQPFISGFIWPRFGSGLVALSFLIFPTSRRMILSTSQRVEKPAKVIFLGNQVLSVTGFVLINYAIFLASVTLVNSLQGVQYVFVLIFSLIVAYKYPKILFEEVNKSIILQKIIAILLIGIGLFILSIQ